MILTEPANIGFVLTEPSKIGFSLAEPIKIGKAPPASLQLYLGPKSLVSVLRGLIGKPLKKDVDSFIQIEKFMGNC